MVGTVESRTSMCTRERWVLLFVLHRIGLQFWEYGSSQERLESLAVSIKIGGAPPRRPNRQMPTSGCTNSMDGTNDSFSFADPNQPHVQPL